ncbi:GvpL/GvpF family gas vesicle protein [Streptomyces turgidiscabies]|uniref:Gas vesicle protein, GvpL/GvpF family n=1 Tax=Streptomyces turgidiscabies (strain Car8) TaxID=698760 RepID=L7F4S9_STRT8|nr:MULTISPECIES: GvpL/GvpF family gas vesicle protein [Streptomyces]ELP65630.1 gas vesicle protein, GvpL/GvpF family [Streptomyces turgidiscabies Car8]MDX3498198.1 GvpL/GvpF family gas vesicle protein [Streptomyces turgidiscabies]GAQ75171.1 Gas vesicle synthesis protein GvpL/GvpF [Streptomyces turgidiscabies]
MTTSDDALTYVYAAASLTTELRDALKGLRGIHGSPVLFLTAPPGDGPGGSSPALAFAISHVSGQEFDEIALKEHFEDLEWLENVARAHHDVVQALSTHTTVLPLRMATVYQDDARAGQALAEQHDALAGRLSQLTAHLEFGVKIYLAPTEPPAGTAAVTDTDSSAAASPGKAYLQRRRVQRDAQEATYGQARQAAQIIEAIAFRYASQHVRHPAQRGALTGPAENVLNDAYLVPDTYAARFRAAVEEAVGGVFDGIRVEVTGPWAPYSFAVPPAEHQHRAPGEGSG